MFYWEFWEIFQYNFLHFLELLDNSFCALATVLTMVADFSRHFVYCHLERQSEALNGSSDIFLELQSIEKYVPTRSFKKA